MKPGHLADLPGQLPFDLVQLEYRQTDDTCAGLFSRKRNNLETVAERSRGYVVVVT